MNLLRTSKQREKEKKSSSESFLAKSMQALQLFNKQVLPSATSNSYAPTQDVSLLGQSVHSFDSIMGQLQRSNDQLISSTTPSGSRQSTAEANIFNNRLLFGGRQLDGERFLESYGIGDCSNLVEAGRLLGGSGGDAGGNPYLERVKIDQRSKSARGGDVIWASGYSYGFKGVRPWLEKIPSIPLPKSNNLG
jgi:hypothetical protein